MARPRHIMVRGTVSFSQSQYCLSLGRAKHALSFNGLATSRTTEAAHGDTLDKPALSKYEHHKHRHD